MHSQAIFYYGARVAGTHPAFDMNFSYTAPKWGCMVYKAFDLYDLHADNNFMLLLVNKNFRVGKRLTITPHAGFFLEQMEHIAATALM